MARRRCRRLSAKCRRSCHIALRPSATSLRRCQVNIDISLSTRKTVSRADGGCRFPIVHGTLGEDGSLQGMLRVANLPFVGCHVLASAACMDKDVTKRLLRDAGLNMRHLLL
ncbi:hypothetical protein ACNKHT_01680 [Shigella flexneri]